jgi:hypothetical protein
LGNSIIKFNYLINKVILVIKNTELKHFNSEKDILNVHILNIF